LQHTKYYILEGRPYGLHPVRTCSERKSPAENDPRASPLSPSAGAYISIFINPVYTMKNETRT
jgi:hypothetical protein